MSRFEDRSATMAEIRRKNSLACRTMNILTCDTWSSITSEDMFG
ncbi:hypothetical protein [Enterococcus raffinosus]|nr:hypothetical protein [Enterococcus raffinosus]